MVNLIALLSSGKGTWGSVNSLIKSENWDKIYLICNDFAFKTFDIDPNKAIKLKYNEKDHQKSFENLSKFFKKEIKDFEVALNISSGSGMEHMAVLSAILKSGLGIRFVYSKNSEVKEFEILKEKFIPEEDDKDIIVEI